MHRDRRYGSLFLVLSILATTWASTGRAQYFACKTVASAPDSLVLRELAPPYPDSDLVATVRCFVHVLREGDASGGLSSGVVDSMLGVVRRDMSTLGVIIEVTDQSDILNSSYYAAPDSFATEIFATDVQEDAINIYLGPSTGAAAGVARGIPSTALLLSGTLNSYSALSHLLGHCLGLYNTDETVFGVEAPDGSNGDTAGDLVADTAADPGLEGWVDSSCEFVAAFADSFPAYAPDSTNIMSQSCMTCWSTFTDAQRLRVMSVIQSYAAISDVAVLSTAVFLKKTQDTAMVGHTGFPVAQSNAAAFDFNGDGKKDILVSGPYGSTATTNLGYAGLCDRFTSEGVPVFTDGTESAFPSQRPPYGTPGLIAADYDNDGNIDFYAPNPEADRVSFGHGHSQRLYHNTGSGAFVDVTSANSLRATGAADWDETISGAWGDYDSDGFLDLLTVVCTAPTMFEDNWSASYLRLYHNVAATPPAAGRTFSMMPLANVGLDANNARVRSVFWVDLDQDHDMDLITVQYTQNSARTSRYYLNTGGQFTDVTSTHFSLSGADDFTNGHICAAPGDFDNDGDVDFAFQGLADRGWVRNDLDSGTGVSTLTVAYNDTPGFNGSDPTYPNLPADLDVFDFDLDGNLDMVVANHDDQLPTRLFRNQASNHQFAEVTTSNLPAKETRAIGAADFHLNGFTDLFLANTLMSPRKSSVIFYKAQAEASGTSTNHWVGIRLEDTDNSCNFRGIGATVIVTAGTHRQAQVVDGGSGQAGQHDLDLSFGLGAYSDSVDVEVIWPCSQNQYARVAPDAYHTISMTAPTVDDNSATMYLNFVLGEETLDWVFEWNTAMPGNSALDWVEFPSGIPGYSGISRLDASMQDVEVSVTAEVAGGTTVYTHRVTWFSRPCADELTAYYKVHSKVLNADDASVRKTLHLYGCPQS